MADPCNTHETQIMTDEILRDWMWVFETWTFPFEKLPGQGATWQKGGTRFGAPRPRPSSANPLAKVGWAGIPAMLHFELYFGDRDGGLSDQGNTTTFPFISHTFSNRRFKRRSDLLDPTEVVTMMARTSGLLPKPEYRRYDGPRSV